MEIVMGIFLAFFLGTFIFLPLGIMGAIALHWIGERALDLLVYLQEQDMKRGHRQ